MFEDKAVELGRLIGKSTEYQALKRANEALTEDHEAVGLLQQLDQLRLEAQQMIERGEEPSQEMEQQLDTILSSIQRKPIYQRAVAAQDNFDKVMVRVNNAIMDGIKKGAASPIITLG